MKRKIRLFGILLIVTALIIMQLPVSEADAATSASDFKMEGTTLVKYRGTEETVSVPNTVEVIGEGAFEENETVESVVLPASVTHIEPYAFWDCDNLESVVLNSGMTEIGDYAFANCKGLKKMTVPDNIRSIGVQAFLDCVNLTDITIPPEVLYIHETSFDGCYRLTIHCEKGSIADKYAEEFYERQVEMPEYEDVDNYGSEEEEAEPTPTPEPVETDPGIAIGDTRVVGNQAVVFINNTSLEVMSGNVSSGLPTEDNYVSENAGEVGGLAKYAIVDGKVVADQAYYKNATLQEVVLPEGIEEVGQFAFARSSVAKIKLPEGVNTIGYGAFYHCDKLKEIILPDTIENVEPKAFAHTLWVEKFLEEGTEDFLINNGVLVAYKGEQEKVTIPEGVRVIAAGVFQNHAEIKELVLPDSLVTVGEAAFEGCSKLSTVLTGKSLKQIKDRAFAACNISKVTLPKTMKEMGVGAFEGTVQITYEGDIPAITHELSAERLSNEAYRGVVHTDNASGEVRLVGMSGVIARLEGASRSYTLSISEAEDDAKMKKAYERCFEEKLSDTYRVYDLLFTDESNIPITKLGKQELELNIPLSENQLTKNLLVYSLDRNGQLEQVKAKRVRIDGVEYLRVGINFVSQIAVVETSEPYSGAVVLEENTSIEKLSQAPGQEEGNMKFPYHWALAGALASAGVICLLWKKNKV